MIKRSIQARITDRLKDNKAIIILGPRQVGKTTLLDQLFSSNPKTLWLNGDEQSTRVLLENVNDGSAYNIGSGKLTSFLELIELFADIAGYQPQVKPLLDKPVGVHSRFANMALVNERFGWKPKISLREGMSRVYEKQLNDLKK